MLVLRGYKICSRIKRLSACCFCPLKQTATMLSSCCNLGGFQGVSIRLLRAVLKLCNVSCFLFKSKDPQSQDDLWSWLKRLKLQCKGKTFEFVSFVLKWYCCKIIIIIIRKVHIQKKIHNSLYTTLIQTASNFIE